MIELYKKYRPKTFDRVIGQSTVISALKSMSQNKSIPHTTLLTGPSGTGKTTIARIISNSVGCDPSCLQELNCADFKGIETARDIRRSMSLAGLGKNRSRVYILDECHELGKPAQNALLKVLEDTPSHVWFCLATTEPEKLLITVRNRCTEFKLKKLHPKEVRDLLSYVCRKEKRTLPVDVVDAIINNADGSARKTLVILGQVFQFTNENEQLEAITKAEGTQQVTDLARALIFDRRVRWSDIAKMIKLIDGEPESIRRQILGYATAIALNGKEDSRLMSVIDCFRDNWYDCGRAGLVLACWQIIKS